tara:strand:+ start:1565 stop:1696 length:132 start_codon:yes stop_codon:yes gene_type:complete
MEMHLNLLQHSLKEIVNLYFRHCSTSVKYLNIFKNGLKMIAHL